MLGLLSKAADFSNSSQKSYVDCSGSFLYSNASNFNFTSSINQRKFIEYYMQVSPVFTATKIISDACANVELALQKKDDGEFLYQHDLLTLLDRPNPFTSGKVFRKALTCFYLMTGNSYTEVVGDSKPVELSALLPQNINIQANNRDGYPQQYNYNSNIGSRIYIRQNDDRFLADNGNELSQLINFNPEYSNNNLFGISFFKGCELEISQNILSNIHNNSLLKNQARPSGLFTYKGVESVDNIDEIQEQIRELFSGAENAGKTAVLNGDYSWQQMSESVKDMDFQGLSKRTEEAIYKAVKIPLSYANQEANTFNNKEVAREELYENAVIPILNDINNYLGELLIPRYPDLKDKYILTFDPASIEALASKQARNALEISKANVFTRDEIRKMFGKEELEDGSGSIIYQPQNLVPVAQDAYTQDNRETPSQDKSIFIKRMIDSGYSEDIIKDCINKYFK
jgi:HK97 family phage portal protein